MLSVHHLSSAFHTLYEGIRTTAHQNLVGAILVAQLGRVALARLELDGDLGVVEEVCAFEDNAETALANLLAHAVVHADDVAAAGRHGGGGRGGRADDVRLGGVEDDRRGAVGSFTADEEASQSRVAPKLPGSLKRTRTPTTEELELELELEL